MLTMASFAVTRCFFVLQMPPRGSKTNFNFAFRALVHAQPPTPIITIKLL